METQKIIENAVQEVFMGKIDKIKFKEDSTGIVATLNTEFSLCDSVIKALLKIGLVDIKRSGVGLKITITCFKL